MSAQEQQQKRKRKQPPTFQHLHPSQAKKLKKAWIEKAQIKSKWSREKRKLQGEGVIPVAKKPWEIPGEEQEETQGSEDKEPSVSRPQETPSGHSEVESEAEERPMKRSKLSAPQKGELPPHLRRNDPSSSHSVPRQPRHEKSTPKTWQNEIQNAPSHTKDPKGKSNVHYSRNNAGESYEEREKSLRDLKREAYDKKHLHNFRADPLHKQSGRGRFSTGRGPGGGGGGSGRGGHGGREPRGQPNMKMRMDYMLQKIKKDYAAPST